VKIPPEEMETCLRVLQRIADSGGASPRDLQFNSLVSKIYRKGKKHDLRREKERQRAEDRDLLESAHMVRVQRDMASPALTTAGTAVSSLLAKEGVGAGVRQSPLLAKEGVGGGGPKRKLNRPESCYVCKAEYTEVHFFYHYLCPDCADLNYRMRDLHADLTGRTALVTGGRVKIGHQTVLRLLRDGANAIVTTRFPHAAAARFNEEPDSPAWRNRLRVYGLDLRNLPVVEEFACHLLQTEPAIDILIHNAAQTIKRPSGFYSELIAQERNPRATVPIEARRMVIHEAPATLAIADSGALLPGAAAGATSALAEIRDILPADALHDNEERADSRDVNSWLLRLDEVPTQELLEVQLVNSIAPFVLNSRLKPLMARSPFTRRFIVNVSAMEGQFGRHKTVYHPHTNMAKAALNMMTHTSGEDYAKDGIYMNSVDTGWVTDENPTPKRLRKQEDRGFFAPLDIIDGMARIYHPIADGINKEEEPLWGKFLKDYAVCRW